MLDHERIFCHAERSEASDPANYDGCRIDIEFFVAIQYDVARRMARVDG